MGNFAIIYCWMDKGTGEVLYVGSTERTKEQREKEHMKLLNSQKHPCKKLQEAWEINAAVEIEMKVLVKCPKEERFQHEKYWILQFPEAGNTMKSENVATEWKNQETMNREIKIQALRDEGYSPQQIKKILNIKSMKGK